MQVTEMTVEQIELQHTDLRQRLDAAVARAATGQGNGNDIAALAAEMASVTKELAEVRERELNERGARERVKKSDARTMFDSQTLAAETALKSFHDLFRAASLALGEFLTHRARASEVSSALSPILPYDGAKLRALEVNTEQAVCDLVADTGTNWRLSYQLTPKYRTQQTSERSN